MNKSLSLFLLCNIVHGMVIPTVEVQHVADDIVKLMKHPSRVVTTEGPLAQGVPRSTLENAVKQRDPIINMVKEGVKKNKAPKRKIEPKEEPKLEPTHQPLVKQESVTSDSASKVPSTQEEEDEFFKLLQGWQQNEKQIPDTHWDVNDVWASSNLRKGDILKDTTSIGSDDSSFKRIKFNK